MRLEAFLRSAAARLVHSDTPHLDMRLFAKAALRLDGAGLLLAVDRLLTVDEIAALDAMIARRVAGESVAHIVGEKEFYGLVFRLAPGVLSPRPDSETLVEAARRRLAADAALRILDLGVGSGALLCALLTVFPMASGVGVDRSLVAARSARQNALRLGLADRAVFFCGDWADALAGAFDLIVSNPPYIPSGHAGELAPEVRLFEDPVALFAGFDGLDAYRRILPEIHRLIVPQGLTILEFGAGQEEAVIRLATASCRESSAAVERDLANRPRALIIER